MNDTPKPNPRLLDPGAVSRVIANVTHELKTPLHSILAVASLLSAEADGGLTPEQKKQVEMIQRNGEHLLELITDLLNFSSIDSGTRRVNYSNFDVRALCEEIVASVKPVADKTRVQVDTDISRLKPSFTSDRGLVRQVIGNLIGNALKFSPDGGKVYFSGETMKDGSVRFEIADTGIGIPVEVQNMIFAEFYQADDGDSRRFGGVGLGLALVKSSLELLGGKVEIRSEPSQGSLFKISIPSAAEKLPAKKVLVIDDDKTVRLSLTECLKSQGYMTYVSEMNDALRQIAEVRPDLLMLDLSSPSKNRSLLEGIRNSPWGKELPIIVMSTLDDPKERALGFELGANDFILKPFDLGELCARVKGQLQKPW